MARSREYVLERVHALRATNAPYTDDRWRVRQIMNGGADGIAAIMAWDKGKGTSGGIGAKSPNLGSDLPAANMMASGVDRLAQKVGMAPMLKMPYGPRDSAAAREGAEVRERIVDGWDALSRIKMMYPQIGRWLPGYAFSSMTVRPRVDPVTRQLYPHTELRDSFDTWPGYFGANQNPHEIAYRRDVPLNTLRHVYPEYDWAALRKAKPSQTLAGGASFLNALAASSAQTWEGNAGGTQILEYQDDTGCYVVCPEFELILDYYANPCDTGPLFVFGKRFSFDKLVSAYHHVIGLVAMMAKMNVLALVASEDAAFSEINIFGELESNTYERGRKGVNRLDANARVEKPKGESNYQLFAQIDRLERQLRIGAAYDQGSDSIGARGGWITGQGQRELRDPIEANIAEYQLVIQTMMEDLDTRRLEWEEKVEKSKKKRVFYLEGDKLGEETYVPNKDIGGNWRSKRAYGMMASWDDNQKIVAGLQLMQAGVIDTVTMQENLSGLNNVPQINQRVLQDRTRMALMSALEQMAAQQNPAAMMTLIDIHEHPDRAVSILRKFFTPQEPQPTPEEQQMLQQPGPEELSLGPGPTVQTVLSELESSGATGGGVQTVAVNRR